MQKRSHPPWINIAGPLGNNAQKSACRRYKNPAATRCTTTKNNDTNYYVLSYMQPIDIHRCKLKLLKVVEASTQKGKLWEKWLLRKPQDIGLTQLPIFLRWQVTQLRFVCLFRQVLHLAFKLQIFPNRTKPHATDDVMQYSSRKTCKCCNASNSKIQKLFSENTDQVTWEENDCWRKQNISLTQLPTFLQSI